MLGFAFWTNKYSNIAGPDEAAPVQWPSQSAVGLSSTNLTLVMFAHPQCPCTRASIDQLGLLMASARGCLNAHVFFLRPAATPENWTHTSLWHQASTIPGVILHEDLSGTEARRFNCLTSGTTAVYGPDRCLLFQGGITIARGHSGDNAGRSSILALALKGISQHARTPAFGCPLFETYCLEKGGS